MSLDFHEYELGDLCNISSSKRIFAREYVDDGIPFYRGKEIIELFNNRDVSNELFITREKYESIKEKYGVPEEGDILLSSVGTLGVPYLVKNEKFYFKDGNLTWFKDFHSKLNNKFLYWWFQSVEAKYQINNKCIGSTQKALPIKTLEKFEINIPSIKTQIQIVDILESISNKIKTNISINKNLLKLSRYLYKEFYMDKVESYDKKEYVTLDDVTSKFATGLNPRKNFVLGEGDNYYVTIKNMANNSIVLDDKCASITDEALVKINKRSDLQVGDLLFSGIGTIGRVHLIDEKPTNWNISESVFTMRPNELISSEFLFIMLLSQEVQEYAKSLASGSVQKGIRMRDLKAFEFILPTEEDKSRLDSLLMPIIAEIKSNEKETRTLTKLRDTLLPKLMSGEIDVSKINCDMLKYQEKFVKMSLH